MVFTALLGSALLAAGPVRDTLAPPDLAAYESANAAAGRDADAHVRLALWCEAHGLQAERLKHLAIAVMTNPKHATARGLMGLVAYGGRWQRPDAVGEWVTADAQLSADLDEYHDRRARAAHTADAQWRLALWCEEKNLKAEAAAHLATVVRLDPTRDAAWKRLGYKKHEGHWVSPQQLASEKDEADRQKQADRHWKGVLEHLRGQLGGKQRRLEADQELARITDPRAVPMICQVFGRGSEPNQKIAVQLLSQVDSPAASRALAVVAVFSRFAEVRRLAGEVLLRRDPREFAGFLVALLRKPIKYDVRPVAGPGSRGELYVEGEKFNVRRLYSPPAAPTIQPGDKLGVDASGMPTVQRTIGYFWTPRAATSPGSLQMPSMIESMRIAQFMAMNGLGPGQSPSYGPLFGGQPYLDPIPMYGRRIPGSRVQYELPTQEQIPIGQMTIEAQQAAQVAETQLERDVAAIKKHNAPIDETNSRILPLLTKVAGEDLGEDPKTWTKWAADLTGYAYVAQKASEEPATVVEDVPIAFQPQAVPTFSVGAPVAARLSHSCFGGGTAVTTLQGRRPIELVRVGDQLLTQDGSTGGLSFQPVVAVYHNPPNRTLQIHFGDDTVIVTGIHRFWKAGRGWTMARELKEGDSVRTVGGLATVTAVETGQNQPVFNLEVARGQSFFVGRPGLLVHDNSLVESITEPFDAPSDLAAATHSK